MKKQRGFSLVELAIVLVIIGLITGGILTGQELIRSSELNRVVSDKNKFVTAMNTFKLKYNALPGDLSNATSYWGTASGGCPQGARSGTQTCNGNGNGNIGGEWNCGDAAMNESLLAWQHLSLSGIIPGNYTGYSTTIGGFCVSNLGVNVPTSSIANAGFMFITLRFAMSDYFGNIFDHALMFGSTNNNTSHIAGAPSLPPAEAKSIDAKVDDGRPGTGQIVGLIQGSAYGANCSTTAVASTADYAVTQNSSQCSLVFIKQ